MTKRGRRHNNAGRSEGEARHIRLDYWIMETDAWLALSANAKVLLIVMAKRFNGRNNGRIAFGVRSGAATWAAMRAISQAVNLGWSMILPQTVAYGLRGS
jgi:hypothetical protein